MSILVYIPIYILAIYNLAIFLILNVPCSLIRINLINENPYLKYEAPLILHKLLKIVKIFENTQTKRVLEVTK